MKSNSLVIFAVATSGQAAPVTRTAFAEDKTDNGAALNVFIRPGATETTFIN
jgi:hypothetical protein